MWCGLCVVSLRRCSVRMYQGTRIGVSREQEIMIVTCVTNEVDKARKEGIEVDRMIITMKDAKKVGEYEATVHFHEEVEVKVPVNVVPENAPVAAPAAEEAPVEAAPAAEEEAPAAE